MSDTWLMLVIAFFAVFGGIGISTAFYVQKVDEIRKQCAIRVEQANAEIAAARRMIRSNEMKARLLDQMPVSRLLEGGNE